jgi:serine protease
MRRPSAVMALALMLAGLAGAPDGLPEVRAVAAAPFVPDDPGRVGVRTGWAELQWNFVGPYGVDAPRAWGNLIADGAPGGAGVTVAVLDTGVAFPGQDATRPGSPDLGLSHVVPGYDFVDDDDVPADQNGHGTHVASTIAEQTDNGYGLTGLAYGADIMPVRVLDRNGSGDAATIASGVRFAVDHGAKVINLSLDFGGDVDPAEIEDLLGALEYAHERGSLVVAGAGNVGDSTVAYPALGPHVVAVGGTTDDGCLADYSNYGDGLDLVAPGGGTDADVAGDPACHVGRTGSPVHQMTLTGPTLSSFDLVGYWGTSMAAAHVSAAAALVVASGVIGADPSPVAIEKRLELTSRDLGRPGYDTVYGWGLVDAGTATSPGYARP